MSRAKMLAWCACLLAAALILSYVEAIIPLGGFRVGLANIAVLLACRILSRRMGFAVMAARVVITSVLFGSATTFAFSMTGGVLAWCVIAILLNFYGKFSFVGISVTAAAAHNFGQVLAACADTMQRRDALSANLAARAQELAAAAGENEKYLLELL